MVEVKNKEIETIEKRPGENISPEESKKLKQDLKKKK